MINCSSVMMMVLRRLDLLGIHLLPSGIFS
jgi:hypothetical protein